MTSKVYIVVHNENHKCPTGHFHILLLLATWLTFVVTTVLIIPFLLRSLDMSGCVLLNARPRPQSGQLAFHQDSSSGHHDHIFLKTGTRSGRVLGISRLLCHLKKYVFFAMTQHSFLWPFKADLSKFDCFVVFCRKLLS